VNGEQCPLADAEALALEALDLRYSRNESTRKEVVADARRFFAFLHTRGVLTWQEVTAAHTTDFYWAASKLSGRWAEVGQRTAVNRQWIVATIVDELADLGIHTSDDPVGVRIPRPGTNPNARPLTDRELHLLHIHADAGLLSSRRALLVVLAEAGGNSKEIAQVRLTDVDIGNATVRFSSGSARINPLTDWGIETLHRALAESNPSGEARLCVGDRLPLDNAARSVSVGLGSVLREAGLSGQPGVTQRSIRLTTARRILDSTGIEAAARFLGNASLDATAKSLHHHWHEAPADG